MDEFDLIDSMLDVLGSTTSGPGVAIGPGDDAAVLEIPTGHQLVVSTDTLVAGRHFPHAANADVVGFRSMAVATSDLAAMGATPAFATVSLTHERLPKAWAEAFAAGIEQAARRFRLAVVGGNVARGPTSVTVTVHGHVPAGQALTRDGAQAGDRVFVSGCLGGAGMALGDSRLTDTRLRDLDQATPLARYWTPDPRLALGVALRGVASAAIDISDGLSSDIAHLGRASGLACKIDLEALPAFPGCDPVAAATAGDDYELAFTVAPDRVEAVARCARAVSVPVHAVGVTEAGTPGHVEWKSGRRTVPVGKGYRHFR